MKKYRVMKDTPFHKEGEIISEDDKLLMYDKEYVPVEIDKLNHFDSFFIASKNNKLVEIRTTIKKYYNHNIGDTILLK